MTGPSSWKSGRSLTKCDTENEHWVVLIRGWWDGLIGDEGLQASSDSRNYSAAWVIAVLLSFSLTLKYAALTSVCRWIYD